MTFKLRIVSNISDMQEPSLGPHRCIAGGHEPSGNRESISVMQIDVRKESTMQPCIITGVNIAEPRAASLCRIFQELAWSSELDLRNRY